MSAVDGNSRKKAKEALAEIKRLLRAIQGCRSEPIIRETIEAIRDWADEAELACTSLIAVKGGRVSANIVVQEWNMCDWVKHVRSLGNSRRNKLNQRLKDPFWVANWREALEASQSSPFLTGENDRGWVMDMDFFLRPESVTRILEGVYHGEAGTTRSKERDREDANASVFDSIRRAAVASGSAQKRSRPAPGDRDTLQFEEGDIPY